MDFFSLSSLIEAKKSRTSPIARGDMDRWLKSVEALARDLEEYKKVKKETDKKLSELKRKHKEAKEKAEKARKDKEAAQARTKAELLRAKKDLDTRKKPEAKDKDIAKRPAQISPEGKKPTENQPSEKKTVRQSRRIIDKKGQRRDGRKQTPGAGRSAGK